MKFKSWKESCCAVSARPYSTHYVYKYDRNHIKFREKYKFVETLSNPVSLFLSIHTQSVIAILFGYKNLVLTMTKGIEPQKNA